MSCGDKDKSSHPVTAIDKVEHDEGQWLCYVGNSTQNQPQTATGRTSKKVFLDKVKVISFDEALPEKRPATGTLPATKLHDVINGVPMLCPHSRGLGQW